MAVRQKGLTVADGSAARARGLPSAAARAPLLGLALFACAGSAAAHGPASADVAGAWRSWSFDPFVILPLILSLWLYGRGVARLWRRLGRPSPVLGPWRAAAFLAGAAMLVLALLSPLDSLAGALLSAHMVQHVLLVTAAPLLLLIGRPELAWMWALSARARRGLARSRLRAALARLTFMTRPVPAAILHAIALWVWHAPAIFDAALAREWLHWLEHACFFGTAVLFWRSLIRAYEAYATAPGVAAALFTLVQSGFLGALLSLSAEPLYRASPGVSEGYGLSPLEDQQLAGVIMWVPMGAAYLAAGLVMAARLLTPRRVVRELIPRPPVVASEASSPGL